MAAGEPMEYRILLNDISQNLSQEELISMKFMCKDIGKRRLEMLGSGSQLFEALEEQDRLSWEKTQFLAKLLRAIGRSDLENKLAAFHGGGGGLRQPTCEAGPNSHDLNVAIDTICDNIGKEWRNLARKLGIKEPYLQELEHNYPRDMKRQIVSVLTEWQRKKGSDASVDNLVAALRSCKLNMVVEIVEEEVKNSRREESKKLTSTLM